MNFTFAYLADGSRGDWLPVVFCVWLTTWLVSLGHALKRSDFDPITRLTWVIVLIFVPFFGILLYWFVSPVAPEQPRRRTSPLTDLSGTPWEK